MSSETADKRFQNNLSSTPEDEEIAAHLMSSAPMDQKLKEKIISTVMLQINAIANKPGNEALGDDDERKFRKLVIAMRARGIQLSQLHAQRESEKISQTILGGGKKGWEDHKKDLMEIIHVIGNKLFKIELATLTPRGYTPDIKEALRLRSHESSALGPVLVEWAGELIASFNLGQDIEYNACSVDIKSYIAGNTPKDQVESRSRGGH